MYRLHRDKTINLFFYSILTVALLLSLLHLITFLFDMTLSVAFFQKANIPSVAYIICHLLIIYIPLLMLIPNLQIPKALILKWVLLAISICFLLGCTWPIYYALENSFIGLFTDDINSIATYQFDSALMFNYMTWVCFSPINVVYSLIQAFLYFVMFKTLYEYRAVFTFTLFLSTLFAIIVPSIYVTIRPERILYIYDARLLTYFKNNLCLLGTQLCSAAGFFAISLSSNMWEKFLWTYARK